MKEKRVVGLDFDDVLVDFCPAILEHHNKIYNTSFVKEDARHFHFEEIWNCTREEAVEEIGEFLKDTKNVLPVSGAIEGVKELARDNDLLIITGRSDTTSLYVEEWVAKHVPGIFKEIIYTNQFRGEKRMSKAEFCKLHNVAVFIDDFMNTSKDLSSAGVPMLLMDAPWNQGELPNLVTRVKTWNEILQFLSEHK